MGSYSSRKHALKFALPERVIPILPTREPNAHKITL